MPKPFRTTALSTFFAILCVATSGYTSCGGGDGSPNPPPVEVDPNHVEWAVTTGDAASPTATATVTQAPGLAAAVQYVTPPPVEWLTATITITGSSSTLLLTGSPQELEPGIYAASVVVTAEEHDAGVVHVVLTVTASPS